MKISTFTLNKLAYIYASIPLFIFLLFWLKPLIALVSVIGLLFIFKKTIKNIPNSHFYVDKKILIVIFIVSFFWCLYAGIGNFSYQSPDWHTRNAIFRDWINFSYPVEYENGSMRVYYMGMFLPGSLFAKLFLIFGEDFAFKIGNCFNLFYVILGLDIIALQLIYLTRATKKQQLLVLFIFIFFSGIDIFGFNLLDNFHSLHLERHDILQYSSNTTLLFWVYNQAIVTWIVVTLFFKKPYKIENFGFLSVCCLFCSPLAFCGFLPYFLIISFVCLIKSIKKNRTKYFLKRIFSNTNIVSFFIFAIICLYFKSNATGNSGSFEFLFKKIAETKNLPVILSILYNYFIIFIFLEAGLYFIPLLKKYGKNLVFQITVLLLCTIPFFRYADTADFCMRASIPSLFILMIFVIKYLVQNNNKTVKLFLCTILFFGALTPEMEFFRSFYNDIFAKKDTLIKDNIKTYNNKIEPKSCKYEISSGTDTLTNIENHCNYGSFDPKEHIFFKYLSKTK